MSNQRLGSAHGGVLAALIDLAGFYALIAVGHPPAATANLNIDYHRPAIAGSLEVRARVVKLGKRVSVVAAEVFASERTLLASGRGAYLMAGQSKHRPMAIAYRRNDAERNEAFLARADSPHIASYPAAVK